MRGVLQTTNEILQILKGRGQQKKKIVQKTGGKITLQNSLQKFYQKKLKKVPKNRENTYTGEMLCRNTKLVFFV